MARTNDSNAEEPVERTAPGTARAFGSEPPLEEPAQPGSDETPDDAAMAPDDVGVSTTRRGEDVIKQGGTEAGRENKGTDDTPAERPTGTSTPRSSSGVNPTEDPESDAGPHSP
ncbi:hypothetical protein AB0O52_11760 [Arthrobacter sp. NPDC080073]|uniref:hypothetical protein n=1 Tax=Arthrobacter sp. NPDC080073 TaxID=3155919 RepID=UPI0034477232